MIIVPSVSDEDAKEQFPERLEDAEAVPARRPAAEVSECASALVAIQLEVGPDGARLDRRVPAPPRELLSRAPSQRRAAGADDAARRAPRGRGASRAATRSPAPARAQGEDARAARSPRRRCAARSRCCAVSRRRALLEPRHAVLAALAPDAERWWKSVFAPLAKPASTRYRRRRLAPAARADGDADERVADVRSRWAGSSRRPTRSTSCPGIEDGAQGGLGLVARRRRRAADRRHAVRPAVHADLLRRVSRARTRQLERFVPMAHADRRARRRRRSSRTRRPTRGRGASAWPFEASRVRVEQWEAEGLPGTLRETAFARYGVTAHLVGSVLDLSVRRQLARSLARADGTGYCSRGGSAIEAAT